MDILHEILSPDRYPPGVVIYLRQAPLIALQVLSQGLLALSYVVIPLALRRVVRARADLPFRAAFTLFSWFLFACASAEVFGIVTLWVPLYWILGFLKAGAAVLSVLTLAKLLPLLPRMLALKTAEQWRQEHEQLQMRISDGERGRREALHVNEDLEARARERARAIEAATHELEREIVERRRAEELLAAEKERLAITLQSIGDGVITTDTRGTVVLINRVAQRLTGWKQDEACGQPIERVFSIINGTTGALAPSPVERVIRSGRIIELERDTILIAREGARYLIADSAAPIRDLQSELAGVVLVFRDITERQRLEDEIVKAQKLEAIGTLAGGIAHDFNNILTTILGNIILAKINRPRDDRGFAVLQEAEAACGRARDLTQQLLTFSRGGAPVKKMTSIGALVEDTARFVLRGSNVRLVAHVAPDLSPVQVDQGQMGQVIQSLVLNAREAMPEGGTVFVDLEQMELDARTPLPLAPGPYVVIRIRDEGPGVPDALLNRIFDPYFTTKQQGSGLGLATTYAIIRKHDGYIQAESEAGRGLALSIFLPAAMVVPEASLVVVPPPARHKGRVLLMDDDAGVCSVGRELLTMIGYSVEVASTGEEAIANYQQATARGQPFDVVILDLTVVGGMGGLECLQRLQAADPGVRAVVSSGYSTNPVMAEYPRWGFRGVIVKPYRLEELDAAVQQALS